MYSRPTQIAELQTSQLEALNAFGSALFNATEKLANLNIAATRALLQDAAETTRNLLGSKNAQEALAIARGLMQPAAERLVGYSRNAYDIARGTNAELSKILEAQVTESNRKVAELFESAFKSAPPGSEAALSFLQSALSASNTAYDTVSNVVKQAAELTESNFAAATEVATDVVKAKARKAA
jgi:phasin family protein